MLRVAENCIVTNLGGGKLAPSFTRQEVAVMLMNYANFKGYNVPVNRSMSSFKDAGQIGI